MVDPTRRGGGTCSVWLQMKQGEDSHVVVPSGSVSSACQMSVMCADASVSTVWYRVELICVVGLLCDS
jgi:hypothetical protein